MGKLFLLILITKESEMILGLTGLSTLHINIVKCADLPVQEENLVDFERVDTVQTVPREVPIARPGYDATVCVSSDTVRVLKKFLTMAQHFVLDLGISPRLL